MGHCLVRAYLLGFLYLYLKHCRILNKLLEESKKKFYQSYIMILTDLSNATKNLQEKILFHKHFKIKYLL